MFLSSATAGPTAQIPKPATAQDPAQPSPSYRLIASVKVEGTGEPAAGARLDVNLGAGPDLIRSGRSGEDGMISIDLPPGFSNLQWFDPPPGFWAPANGKRPRFEGFILSKQAPTFRKDYVVRRGTIWEFALSVGSEPAQGGTIMATRPDGNCFQAVANESGRARLTLPTEQGEDDLWLIPPGDALFSRRLTEHASWDAGFLPGAVKTITKQDAKFRLQDRDGRSAVLDDGGGRVEPIVQNGVLLVRVRLDELPPAARGTISGKVLDPGGLAVDGARVSLAFVFSSGGGSLPSDPACHAVTNARGEFVLRSVPRQFDGLPVQFSLVVSKDGLAGIDTPPVEFRPDAGDSIHQVDPIRLGPEGIIRGTVVDEKGQPAVGARVIPGHRYSLWSRSTRTDGAGRFVVRGIPRDVTDLAVYFGGQEASERVLADGLRDVAIHLEQAAKIQEKQLEMSRRVAEARLKRVQPLAVNDDAPAWSLGEWSDGRSRAVGDYRGRVLLLVFWSTSCAPCVQDLPNLEALRKTYEARGVVVLSILTARGDPEKIRQILKLKGANFPFAIDRGDDEGANGETADHYGVPTYPTLVIIDSRGKVAFHSFDPALKDRARAIAQELKIAQDKMSTEDMNRIDGALLTRELDAILQRNRQHE
jgi:peroxiredoxin